MYKHLGCALALTVFSGLALASPPPGTIGIGVAHTNGSLNQGNTIFLPMTLGNGLWVEPFASYTSTEDKASGDETTAFSIGAGLFKNFWSTANTRAYLGGRLGYTYFEYDPATAGSIDDNGFMIQPVIGFGYQPVDSLMLGAEAYVTYQDSDISGTETLGTGTSLFARYYFIQ